jgi:hypothetical protein
MTKEPLDDHSLEMGTTGKASDGAGFREVSVSHQLGRIILLIIWIPVMRVFSIWLPYPLAAGLSSLAVILVGYRFQSEHKKQGYATWAARGVIYASIITAITYFVSSLLDISTR